MSKQPVLLIVIICCLSSCKSTLKLADREFHNDLFTIYGVQGCIEAHTGDAVDSQIGEIACKDITFTYDFGRYGERPPMSPAEMYRESFDNYHYSKFFELTHVDQKVQKIFKDSVHIVKLHQTPTEGFKTMFDCSTCNAVAEVTFKGRTWYFPSTVSENIFDTAEYETTSKITTSQLTKVYTISGETLHAGIFYLPFRKQRDFLAIAVKETTLGLDQQRKILDSIILQSK